MSENFDVALKNCSRIQYNCKRVRLIEAAGLTFMLSLMIGSVFHGLSPLFIPVGLFGGFGIMALAKPKKETIDFTEMEACKTSTRYPISKFKINHETGDDISESIEALNYLACGKTENLEIEDIKKIIHNREWRDTSLKLDKQIYEEEGVCN